jgi:serine/threonine protein kinase
MCKGSIKNILKERWPDCEHFADGGNSYIYKATYNGHEIAIKVYNRLKDRQRYKRFLSEIDYAEKFSSINGIVPQIEKNNHPPDNPIECEQLKTIDDLAWFTMPKYSKSLSEIIEKETIWKDDGTYAVKVALEIAVVIKELHDRGFAHRDLKPDNVLADENGKMYVSDFGLSIDLRKNEEPVERLSRLDEIIGSIAYRPPEFLRGKLGNDNHTAADVFSLGRILWALIWGEEPYNLTDLEFQEQTINKCGRALRKTQTLMEIIKGATESNPEYRLNIDQFIKFLTNWQTEDMGDNSEKIFSAVVNSDAGMAQIEKMNVVNQIYGRRDEVMAYVRDEWNKLMNGWQQAVNRLREKGVGNILEISPINDYYADTSPEILGLSRLVGPNIEGYGVRFNLGLQGFPFLVLSILYTLDLSRFDNQSYQIIASYWDEKEKKMKLAIDVIEKRFDYQSADLSQNIISDLRDAFKSLDDILSNSTNHKYPPPAAASVLACGPRLGLHHDKQFV